MRIAQVSPLYESVPPAMYGGTERVVSYLTEALVALGHDVTLFASGDSVTRAHKVALCPQALRTSGRASDWLAHYVLLLERVMARAVDFDILHFHIDYIHFPFVRRTSTRSVTTLHGRLDLPDLVTLYGEFAELPLVSVSDAQRRPLPAPNWAATVHHGLPSNLHVPRRRRTGDGYLAFLGRISPEKRADRAVEIAARVGKRLRVGAKVDAADREYFQSRIKPLFEQEHVEFLGEVNESAKHELLAGADALLFPIDWPEPFGLVMIEALACGTPVIAFRRGSVPEIIEDGVSGF